MAIFHSGTKEDKQIYKLILHCVIYSELCIDKKFVNSQPHRRLSLISMFIKPCEIKDGMIPMADD